MIHSRETVSPRERLEGGQPGIDGDTQTPATASGTTHREGEYVPKVYAYITRDGAELLTFAGPDHDAPQIPKGTVESGASLPEAVEREVREETGLKVGGAKRDALS